MNYPFGVVAKESYDIERAKQILDEDHYGMKKVKQRILEFIAVSKIKGEFKCTFEVIFSEGFALAWASRGWKDQHCQIDCQMLESSFRSYLIRWRVRHKHHERA